MQSKRVVVTGSAGRIGRAVVRELVRRGHVVRGFDRMATPGVTDAIVGELTDAAAVERAMAGMETLIHLAATPDDADFETELLPNNFLGVYRVLESAQQAKVQRMILASSGQVVWHQRKRGPLPIGPDVVVTPRGWYAAGKVFLEAAGRALSETYPISVVVVRLGWCPRTWEQVDEIESKPVFHDVYLSPADAGRFFACAVEAPGPLPYAVIYATSRPVRINAYDLDDAKRLLSYEPRDQWPDGIELPPRS